MFKDTYYGFLNTKKSQIQTYEGPTRIMTFNQIPKPNKVLYHVITAKSMKLGTKEMGILP